MVPKKDFILQLLFALAGFSLVSIKGLKLTDFVIILSFLYLIQKHPLKNIAYAFFLFSFFYAWALGGFIDYLQLISNSVVFGLIFLLRHQILSKGDIPIMKYLKLFVNSMFVSNGIAITAFLVVPGAKPYVAEFSSSGYRFYGFFTQPNGYSFVLIITLFLSIYVFVKKRNLFNFLKVVVTVVALFLAQSRGAIFGVFGGLALIYFIYLIRRGKIRQIAVTTIMFAGFLALGFIVLPNFLSEKFGVDLARLSESLDTNRERSLTSVSIDGDRAYLVNAAIKTIQENPFGLGYQEQYKVIGKLTGIYKMPHNYFISVILNYGIIIGFIWLTVYMWIILKGLRTLFFNNIGPNQLMFYLIAMLSSISLFMLTHDTDWTYFYLMIGVYLALLKSEKLRYSL